MKRIISVLILVCLMASFCTLSAFAAEVTVSTQAEFEGAMTTAASGDTIVLGAGDFTMVEPNATITIKYSAGTNLTFPDGERYEDRVTYDTGGGGGAGGGIMLLGIGGSGTVVTTEADLIAAFAAGGDVTLGADIALTNPITIPAGVTVTLDLNGKTLSYLDTSNRTTNTEMIKNHGNLTVKDSADGGSGGSITYQYTGAEMGTSKAANTITSEPGSVFTLESGSIINNTNSTTVAYAIDGRTNGGMGDVTVNIKGGSVSAAKQAVRIFANSTTNTGTLNISGGEITGRVIVQNANASANKAAANISGGTFKANGYKADVLYLGGSNGAAIDMDISISNGSFKGPVNVNAPNTGFITGGDFAEKPEQDYIAPGLEAVTGGENGFVINNPNAPTGGGAAQGTVSNPYAIPATGDMSNMPLWAVLFLGFAAVAVLTRKKKA